MPMIMAIVGMGGGIVGAVLSDSNGVEVLCTAQLGESRSGFVSCDGRWGLQVNVSCMPAVQTKYPSLRCNFAMVSPDAVNFIHY